MRPCNYKTVGNRYQLGSQAVQISAIFFDETTGFSSFSCFLPKLMKSVSQEWSSGILWTLQNSAEQYLQAYPNIPVFLVHFAHFPFGSYSLGLFLGSSRFRFLLYYFSSG